MKNWTPDGMRKFTITFNGKTEHWYLSKEEMTHPDAMAFIEKAGKQAPKLIEMLEEDDSGKTRLQLLNEAGAEGWAWCKDSPFGNSCYAFNVYLSNGIVYSYGVRSNFTNLPLCRD